ncbi:MAG: OmpA family protein [Rickettsiales bacterium]|jgi:peptidoglycan-associated lipoprotein|nr:OmpA family protein [Rickettsiales bacterium]
MKKINLLFALGCLLFVAACTGIREPAELDGDKAYFAFDSAEISKEAQDNLLGQSLYMKHHKDTNITIEGHCDERGTTEYNLALGALRSANAAQVLLKDGVKQERVKTISYGKEKPQYTGHGEEIWAKNRNATTKVEK